MPLVGHSLTDGKDGDGGVASLWEKRLQCTSSVQALGEAAPAAALDLQRDESHHGTLKSWLLPSYPAELWTNRDGPGQVSWGGLVPRSRIS